MNIHALILEEPCASTPSLFSLLSEHCPDISILFQTDDAAAALAAILRLRPELVFFDLEIAGNHFLELLEKADLLHTSFVVVAERDNFAREAFRFNTTGYLLKPVALDDLLQSLQKYRLIRLKNRLSSDLHRTNLGAADKNIATLSLSVSDGILFIPVSDIRFIRAEGPYATIHYGPDKQILVAKPLKELAARLPYFAFERVHNSYLVNLAYVEKMHRDGYLILNNAERIDVSRSRRQEVIRKLLALKNS
jgi:two-component system LytT family response regulator